MVRQRSAKPLFTSSNLVAASTKFETFGKYPFSIKNFHVHSKFSRATAKNLDLENLYIAAQLKDITVVGP